jgi:hypothetical protein
VSWDKLMIPVMVALLAGLFSAVIWPTHERARENAVELLEFRKENYARYRSHLRTHREEIRLTTQILEQWCTERECTPAEQMRLRQAQGNLAKWDKRVENFIEEHKHMGK